MAIIMKQMYAVAEEGVGVGLGCAPVAGEPP